MGVMQEEPLSSMGACLRAVRLRRGLSQKTLAMLLDVTPPTINRYENNQRQLTAKRLQDIAHILHVPIDYLYPQSCTCAALASLTPLCVLPPSRDGKRSLLP